MRVFLAVLLIAVAYPGFAALYGVLHGTGTVGVLAWSSHHLPLVWAGAAAAVVAALLLLERPRSVSARKYGAQLQERFRLVQSEFEGAVEVALPDRTLRESDQSGPDAPGAAPQRLDGREAVDNTRR